MVMLHTFWSSVQEVDPDAGGERRLAGAAEGDIARRFERAGLGDVIGGELVCGADYASFDDFWEPFTFAVGPAGQYLASLDDERRTAVREACRAKLPSGGPFSLDARAWYARGTAPGD
jgi:hypothetical protein